MKGSNDTIRNQYRDLPVCSAVPQPSVPSHDPKVYVIWEGDKKEMCET
jgi:hypothetical protein